MHYIVINVISISNHCNNRYYTSTKSKNWSEPKTTNNEGALLCDSMKLTYLEEIITSCEENGIQLVFTASPIYKPVSDMSFAPIKELCKKYQVPFLNHYCDSNFCYSSDFFADGGHLNKYGAELVTSIMASEIKHILR